MLPILLKESKTAAALLQLSELELQTTLLDKYKTSWESFMQIVLIMKLGKLRDEKRITYKKKFIEDFLAPARIIDQLGLWE